jgi:perosamine synthetase
VSNVIPLFRPACSDEEIEAVTRVMKSGWWACGPETEAFEDEFAAYAGARYAVAVNSGTMALKLSAMATGLTGGIVVCPALTFISTALVMHQLGNTVIFADINDDTLTLNWHDVRSKFAAFENTGGTRGVVPVWYAGFVDPPLYPLPACTRVIEDCAHAAGSSKAGKVGRVAAWSFQAVKNLACGDGGMVTTDDEHVAREVRRLRWVGIDRSTWDRDKNAGTGYGWDYDIAALDGEKAHMNDISAAIGRVQLRLLDDRNSVRRAVAAIYREQLHDLGWLRLPVISRDDSAHLYVVRVPQPRRTAFIRHMLDSGVSAGVHYKPLTHYKDVLGRPLFGCEPESVPMTEHVWETLVTLPLFPGMTDEDIETVISGVRSFPV